MYFPRLTRRIQFSLSSLFLGMTAVAAWYGWGPPLRAWLAVRQLSNADVRFAGSYSGYAVGMSAAPAGRLRALGKRANPTLRAALGDPCKFAAAHVLLGEINGVPEFGPSSMDDSEVTYHRLRIRLHGTGPVDFPPEQMPDLQQYWRERLVGPLERGL